MHKLPQDDLEDALQHLEQAIFNHQQWTKRLMRSLTCHLPHDEKDLKTNAHCMCKFGQWYYGEHPPALKENVNFQIIESHHKTMHDMARSILQYSEKKHTVDPKDYDSFAVALETLQNSIGALKKEIEELLLNRDPLTGAYNRVSMETEMNQIHELVKRDVHSACIVMIDIDHFKPLNDQYGHPVGDAVLAKFSEILQACLRPYDKLFRYGGEEFLVSLINTDENIAMAIAERFKQAVSRYPLYREDDIEVSITASFGIALFDAEQSFETALKNADKALYKAKNSGRNRVVLWQKGA